MSQPSAHLTLVPRSDTDASTDGVDLDNYGVWFGEKAIISGVNLSIPAQGLTCLVGPSGAGKSTLLRSINRMNDDVAGHAQRGTLSVFGNDVKDLTDVTQLRRDIGMVFQKPCVFPRSIADNVVFGLRDQKLSKASKREIVEDSLRKASLWDDVARRLGDPAAALSLGQQQRLCIARMLAMRPKMILMDEPTASVDPHALRAIETLMMDLAKTVPVIVVTHNIRQAKRIADHLVFLCDGTAVEEGTCAHMFSPAAKTQTQLYLSEEICDC